MPQTRFRRSGLGLASAALAGWVALGSSLACACTIPVFRYALERWECDRFLVVVYHDNQLTAEQNSAILELTQRSSVMGGPLNIEVFRHDLASPSPLKLLDLKLPPSDRELPWVEIRARVAETRTAVRWQGPLTDAIGHPGLFDSPARTEIVRRLLNGDSCVFVLVAPEEHVQQQSKQLETMLEAATDGLALPQGIGLPGSELFAPIPLEIRFSVMRLSHTDPEEQAFLKLLAASAEDWRTDTAYVIPVFGRCRALAVFPYTETDELLIQDVGSFLCAACSCRVKQANPGFDLIVSVNWNQRLFGESMPQSIRVGMQNGARGSSGLSRTPEYLTIPSGNHSALVVEPIAETPMLHSPVHSGGASNSAPTASGNSTDVTTFHQTAVMIEVILLVVLVGCAILGGFIYIRR